MNFTFSDLNVVVDGDVEQNKKEQKDAADGKARRLFTR
jgi:hypothetical protein